MARRRAPCFSSRRPLNLATRFRNGTTREINGTGLCHAAHCGAWWTPTWEHVTPGPPAALVCPACGVEHPDGPDRVRAARRGPVAPDGRSGRSRGPQLPLAALAQSGRGPWRRSSRTINAPRKSDRWRPGRGRARRSQPNRIMIYPMLGRYRRGSKMSRAWPPDGISFTVAATDVQSNRLETLILGMPADRSWGAVLDYHVTRGRPTEAAVWKALQAHLGSMPACGLGRSTRVICRWRRGRWRTVTRAVSRS